MKNFRLLLGLATASLFHLACSYVVIPQRTRLVSLPSSRGDILQIDHETLPHIATKTTKNYDSTTKNADDSLNEMSPLESKIRKFTMLAFVASMCIFLPLSLLPVICMDKAGLIDRPEREELALDAGQGCARLLLKIMPFLQMHVDSDAVDCTKEPEPSIWVCNHTSMLDTFILMAADKQLRGPNKRPIKVIYWKGLEDNPICNLLFKLSGFIPVAMEANGSGNPNSYDKKSFISLLRQTKKAFAEGFDILVLPEGQLNPWPESGLLEVFPGAHKMSLLSKRPIRMVGLYGLHKLWSENPDIGMTVTAKDVKVRGYSAARIFESGEEFVETFSTVVGHFGATGLDHPNLEEWLTGNAWKKQQAALDKSKNEAIEDVEEAIRAVLQRESHNILKEDGVVINGPTGVHTRKFPPTMHSLDSIAP